MVINFANLSNEGVNIPSSQKINSPTGKKKEILGAGDLAQALTNAPAKAQRFISDEEIKHYAEVFANDENVQVITETEKFEVVQQVYPYKQEEYMSIMIFGMRFKKPNWNRIKTSMGYLSVVRTVGDYEDQILEIHYVMIFENVETGEVNYFIDYIPQ